MRTIGTMLLQDNLNKQWNVCPSYKLPLLLISLDWLWYNSLASTIMISYRRLNEEGEINATVHGFI